MTFDGVEVERAPLPDGDGTVGRDVRVRPLARAAYDEPPRDRSTRLWAVWSPEPWFREFVD